MANIISKAGKNRLSAVGLSRDVLAGDFITGVVTVL